MNVFLLTTSRLHFQPINRHSLSWLHLCRQSVFGKLAEDNFSYSNSLLTACCLVHAGKFPFRLLSFPSQAFKFISFAMTYMCCSQTWAALRERVGRQIYKKYYHNKKRCYFVCSFLCLSSSTMLLSGRGRKFWILFDSPCCHYLSNFFLHQLLLFLSSFICYRIILYEKWIFVYLLFSLCVASWLMKMFLS